MYRRQLLFTDAVIRRAEQVVARHPELRARLSTDADLAAIRAGATSAQTLALACERYADRVCFAGAGGSITYGELWARVTALATSLVREGFLVPRARVGIYGASRTDWVVADFASLVAGAVSVPLSLSSSDDELRLLVEHAELGVIFCDKKQLPVLARALAGSSTCRAVIVMHEGTPGDLPALPWRVASIGELERSAARERVTPFSFDEIEPVTVMYTSGSTGRAKGVILHERRWLSQLRTALDWPPFPHVQIGYLPHSSIAGRRFIVEAMMHGGLTHFASDVLPFPDVPVVRPTLIGFAPRVSTVLYQRFKSELLARHGITDPNLDDPRALAILDEMRETAIGDRLSMIRLGSGDSAPDVLAFLERCFGVPVMNSYGQTETSSIAINGHVLPYVEYRLVDVPELGYSTAGAPPRGELVVRSIDCVPGYLNDPEATAALFEPDGFLKTGDIMEERAPGELAWIDRRQSVVKLSQGLFVAPSRLEFLYVASSPYIQQMYLYANPRLAFLLAVIVPNLAAFDAKDAADPAAIRRVLRSELDRVSRAEQLRSQDIPRDFIVELEPFSEANGLLLETLKQSPRRLRERYAPALDQLGAAVEGRQVAASPAARDVRGMFASVLGLAVDELAASPNASFTGFGGDSVSALRFCALVEEAFGVSVPVGIVLDPSSNIGTTIERVEALLAHTRTTPAFRDVHGDAKTSVNADDLRRLIPAGEGKASATARAPSRILLTGASGFLGRMLVLELLRRMPASGQLTCIVRGRDDAAARERMREAFAATTPELARWFDDVTATGRLVLRAGDLQAPKFGLAPGVYDELAASLDAIVHNGALVNHAMSYRDLFEPNVLGSVEIARMAARRPDISITFISSIGVAARPAGAGTVAESDRASRLWPTRPVGGGPDDHAVGYVTSKWAGEVLFEELHARYGTAINIVRCSNLAPHREFPAHLNWADMTNRLLVGIAATGLAPDSFYAPGSGAARHDMLPLDAVAATIADVACNPAAGIRSFHASSLNVSPMSLDTLVGWVESAGIAITRMPHAAWYPAFRAALERLAPAARARSPLAAVSRYSVPHPRDRFAPIETGAFEQRAGTVAVLDEARVHTWLRALRDA